MAEFLVMAKKHWSYKEDMTIAEQAKYDKQYQIGDIVQVFQDGKLQDFAHAGGKFYVLRIKGLSFEDALKYHESYNADFVENVNVEVKSIIWNDKDLKAAWLVENKFISTPIIITADAKTYTVIGNITSNEMLKRRKYNFDIISLVESGEELKNSYVINTILDKVKNFIMDKEPKLMESTK